MIDESKSLLDKLEDPNIENGMIVVPKELLEAPQEIQDYYVKWVTISQEMHNNPRRYFQFVNQVSGELSQVDCLGLTGQAESRAKTMNIDKTEIVFLRRVQKEMDEYKKQKTRYKMKWLAYLRPRMGKDVFDWRKGEIVDMFAKYLSIDEVKKKLIDMGYVVQHDSVYKFFLNNRDLIDKKRLEFIRSTKDYYLATDAGRMETLAMLHSRFVELFNEAYNKVNRRELELRALSQEIRAIVEQARREIKGEEIKLTVDGKIDINASLQAAATIQDISKKLPINIIPIYLVAVKQGINPNRILASLVGSFYKDFNGFNRFNTTNPPQTTMDIIRNYDWNEIRMYHENKPKEQTEDIIYEDLSFVEEQKVKTKREKLLEMINSNLKEKDSKQIES